MQTVVLIDYGSGNLHSAQKAVSHVAAREKTSFNVVASHDPEMIVAADRVLLPGVGAFGACMAALRSRDGVLEALNEAVFTRGRPFLGICVGMQLLADRGLEHGEHDGLGWIGGTVCPLNPEGVKIPHMGWNDVHPVNHPLLEEAGDAYFVHSYRYEADDPSTVIATCDYGDVFPAAIAKGNIAGAQFHPEKSQDFGLAFLSRFLCWEPR